MRESWQSAWVGNSLVLYVTILYISQKKSTALCQRQTGGMLYSSLRSTTNSKTNSNSGNINKSIDRLRIFS